MSEQPDTLPPFDPDVEFAGAARQSPHVERFDPSELESMSPVKGAAGMPSNLMLLAGVELEVSVELGRVQLPLAEVLKLSTGSVVELEKLVGEPLAVYANGRLIAEGEAVVVGDQFGVRIIRLAGSSAEAA